MFQANRASSRIRASPHAGASNARHLRQLNLARILSDVIDRSEPFTRNELIQTTGLSAPTVGSLISHLIRRGVVHDLGVGPSRGGRRPSFMQFNARYGFVAGIDLGPTNTRLALADLRGAQLAHHVLPTPVELEPAALLSRVASSVRALMREVGVAPSRLLAVGAGAPGAVDWGRGTVDLAPNLKGWSNVPMAAMLKRSLGAPVVVDNDVNLAALGERWRGAARGHDTCAFVTVGTGIGAGIVVDGTLHRGHHFVAGEIGLMCMGPQYLNADFGPRGCLESLAGLKAVLPHLAEDVETASAENGDPDDATTERARLIGIAVANLSLVLDPSLVVLGGALTQAEPLLRQVRRIVGRIVPAPIEIVVSSLGQEAPLWGSLLRATMEARDHLLERVREG